MRGSDLFFYEGRTIRGLGLVGWALVVQTAAVAANGVVLVGLGLLIPSAVLDPSAALGSLVGILVATCGIEMGELAVLVVFLVGFAQLHAGRHEYGLEHARALERALIFLVVAAVVDAAGGAFTIASSFTGLTGFTVPTDSLLVGNLVVGPLVAAFAGLVLISSARAIADPAQVRRLWTGLGLGGVGAALGPALLGFSGVAGPQSLGMITTAYFASAVAGDGISALSLLLFFLILRDVRRQLLAGIPPPVLPRYAPPAPWGWPLQPPPPTTIPPGPREPPKT